MRNDFPIFKHHPNLVYLDSAATAQKPQAVIDAITSYYEKFSTNVHRGVYKLAVDATSLYEQSRQDVKTLLNAKSATEIVFTYGTTFGLNLLAKSLCPMVLQEGDEILLPISEHHANIVSWELEAKKKRAFLKFIPLKKDGSYELDLEEAKKMVSSKTKIISFAHVSNVLGGILPVKELVALARSVNALAICDGAQGIVHLDVDVQDLDVDFYAFSAHKLYGPTGVGALYGKKDWLEKMPPFLGGGDMIATVSTKGSTFTDVPHKFEAGTPPIDQVIGLGAAVRYFQGLDRSFHRKKELELSALLLTNLKKNPFITCHTPQKDHVGIVTFTHSKIHPHDLASILDMDDVCIRAGLHCAQPLASFLGVHATSRVSFGIYNETKDVERFLKGLEKAEQMLLT